MTAKAPKKKVRRFQHAPRLLFEMCRASQEGLSASDWQRLFRQKRYADLAEAFAKYAPDAKTPRAIGWALRDLVGVELEYDGEQFELVSRWFNGDASHRYGVRSPLREKILAAKEKRKQREESNLEAAKVIARQLRRGELDPDALAALAGKAVPSESIAERSVREAAAVSRVAGWIPPPPTVRKPEPPPVAIDPEPTAPPVDKSNWPPAWRKHGKPNYSTVVREIPDDSFKNFAPAAPSAAECGLPSPDIYPRSPLPK